LERIAKSLRVNGIINKPPPPSNLIGQKEPEEEGSLRRPF